jgi:hypothetical protein
MINLFCSLCIFLYGYIGCDVSGRAFSGVPSLTTSLRFGFLFALNFREFVLLSFTVVEPIVLRRLAYLVHS